MAPISIPRGIEGMRSVINAANSLNLISLAFLVVYNEVINMASQTSSKMRKVPLQTSGQRPPCSDATRDLLRRKLLENLAPKLKTDPEGSCDEFVEVGNLKGEDGDTKDAATSKGERSFKRYPASLELHLRSDTEARKAHLARKISRQMSSPETPPLVIATTPCETQTPDGTPTTTTLVSGTQYSRQLSVPLSNSMKSSTHSNRPKIFCVTTTAESMGIDTPPPSADDYLVKPSSAGILSPKSATSIDGNSPFLRQSSTGNPLSPQTQSSPPLLRSPPPFSSASKSDSGVGHENSSKSKRDEVPNTHNNSIMLPALKDLIEKTYPKLPTSLTEADGEDGPYLIIECERVVTLPNLLGPVRPARLVLCGKGHFSFQCLFKELYSGSLSDNLLFSVALKSLTNQSEFRLCMASLILEGVHGSMTQTHSSSGLHQLKWGESLNQLLDSHRCLMWFSPSDHDHSQDDGSGDKWSENHILGELEQSRICKNCRSRVVELEKVHKQQQQQSGHHKQQRQDSGDKEENNSEKTSTVSNSAVLSTASRGRVVGTSPLTIATKSSLRGRVLKSAPVTLRDRYEGRSRLHAENVEVKKHLQEMLLARVQRMQSLPHSPLPSGRATTGNSTSSAVTDFAMRFSSSPGGKGSRKRHKGTESGSAPTKSQESPQKKVPKKDTSSDKSD